MTEYIKSVQKTIFNELAALDPTATIREDSWVRPAGGGSGLSCIIQDGKVFEKAGCNISIVEGKLSPGAVKQMRADHASQFDWYDGTSLLPYNVCGLSLVVHPVNPMAPTVHLNYRYFEIYDPNEAIPTDGSARVPKAWWFGGGTDLTPSYLFEEDAIHFHSTIKDACDKHNPTYYPTFKKWCDKYFYIPHRQESRGIGGIFYDDLSDVPPEELVAFAKSCGESFVESYIPLIKRRKDMPFTEENVRWQQLRRGRYVEFNLVHDRGTKFGLMIPGARTESILMSLPLKARFEYMSEMGTEFDSEEAKLMKVLKEPREWV